MKQLLLLLFFSLLIVQLQAQTIARFEVDAGNIDRNDVFVNAPVLFTADCNEKGFQLFEVTPKGERPVPFQIEYAEQPRIWWRTGGLLPQGSVKVFELRASDKTMNHLKLSIRKTDQSYILFNGDQQVLHYNYAKASLPAGVDTAFSRSGYIHPLFSPAGKVLTMIQPPDHFHHYGLWNAWTRTVFNGKQVDFWNLGDKQGRVDYTGTISTIQGGIFQALKTLHHHIAIEDKNIALNEELEVRVFNNKDFNIIDYTTSFNCAHPDGILLEEYRYGGFVFRGNEKWNGNTVDILTSEGRDQNNSDGQPARWCLVNEKGDNPSGILIMSSPANFNHPQPLRTWDSQANAGQSNIFINFCPIRNRSWQMVFGNRYTLQYRVITFDGRWTKEQAHREWVNFSNPPVIEVIQ
jgi:hypothetical protein